MSINTGAVFVSPRIHPCEENGLGWTHMTVQNGIAFRIGLKKGEDYEGPYNAPYLPLEIIRSGRVFPEIFSRSNDINDIIVSGRVAARLKNCTDAVGFHEVVIRKLIDLEMPAKGDDSWVEKQPLVIDDVSGPRSIYRRWPNMPDLFAQAPQYFEVVPPHLYDLQHKFSPAAPVTIVLGDETIEVNLSVAILAMYPIVWSSCYIFRGDVFDCIADFVSPDYFLISTHHF